MPAGTVKRRTAGAVGGRGVALAEVVSVGCLPEHSKVPKNQGTLPKETGS